MRRPRQGLFDDTMLWGGAAFVAGVGLVQQWPALPASGWLALLPLAALPAWRWRRWRIVAALAAGVAWAVLSGHMRLAHTLPEELAGRDITVQGVVQSIPEPRRRSTRFEFLITSGPEALTLPFPVRLSWYQSRESPVPALHAGQRWQLRIRLKPPHGMQNPGGFDYETWLFSRGIRATGYIRAEGDNSQLDGMDWRYAVPRSREFLLNRLKPLTADTEHGALLLALALGYRGAISDAQWDRLTGTGTNHLMAISGLHIGLVAGLLYAATLFGLRQWHRRAGVPPGAGPMQRRAALVAVAGAAMYALLAGFSLPTRRALIMLVVGMTAIIAFRPVRPAHALVLALVAVVALDPFAVNTAGFWLSFSAVAVLVYAYAGRLRPPRPAGPRAALGWIATWARVQWLLVLGLLPLTLFWFGGAALAAAAANLVAIPLVGFVVVPLTLAATAMVVVWPPGAEWLLQAAHGLLALLWPVLEYVSQWPLARWERPPPPLWTLFPAAVGMALLLAPRGFPARWVGVGWLMPALLAVPDRPPPGELALSVLDVGQGTSVVAQTAGHALVYDAGPKTGRHFDTGELVVVPFLKSRGIRPVDTLLISHGDNDHIGGAESVMEALPVKRLISSVPEDFGRDAGAEPCRAGQRWQWDGVEFEMLHPMRAGHWEGNNASCVLQITAGGTRVLLSGDIEDGAERQLLRRGRLNRVDLLVAPHHGSRSSSTPAFIEALQPAYTVFTAGLFNRYGFPKAEVTARYRRAGSAVRVSGRRGALTFEVSADGVVAGPGYRQTNARYWHYRPALPHR